MISIVMRRVITRLPNTCYQQHVPFSHFRAVHNSANACSDISNEDRVGDRNECTLSHELIHHLERTSLVDFDNNEALVRLSEAIKFSAQLLEVKTDGVEPLITVLEKESLFLRDDTSETCARKDVLKNACITEEDYFVSPPGNVPLEPSRKLVQSRD